MSKGKRQVKPEPRDIQKHSPFAWFQKSGIWLIRDALEDLPFLDQTLAVYLTHCELSSDEQCPTYKASRREISKRSGVSIRRVSEIHSIFERLKLITWRQTKISGTKELGPSTYTLLGLTPSAQPALPSAPSAEGAAKTQNGKFAQSTNNLTKQSSEQSLEEGARAQNGKMPRHQWPSYYNRIIQSCDERIKEIKSNPENREPAFIESESGRHQSGTQLKQAAKAEIAKLEERKREAEDLLPTAKE